MGAAESDHSPSEAVDLFVFVEQAPVEPAHLVILAVGIVVTALSSAKLISAEQHGNSSRDKQRQQEVLDQAVAHALDGGILGRPCHAAIVAVVSIASIAAELAVLVIVLLLVANQVVKCEAIMTSDEVEATGRSLARAFVQIGASSDSACERAHHARVADPEAAHIITETAVPFRPTLGGKTSHLIGAACVPCFRDNLYVTQDGILGNAFQKRSVAQTVPMFISAQDGSEVEAKSVNVHVH